MKLILVLIICVFSFCTSLKAQSVNDVKLLCQKANESATKNELKKTLELFNSAVAIVKSSGRYDLVVDNINYELVDYLIAEIAKKDTLKAKKIAEDALNVWIRSIIYSQQNTGYKTKEDYVDDISAVYTMTAQILADAGILSEAEKAFLKAINAYSNMGVYTHEYPYAYERVGWFYETYKDNPAWGLDWRYEAFLSAISLSGLNSELSRQIFCRMYESYQLGFAFYSLVAADRSEGKEQPQEIPIYSYEQVIELTNSWRKICDEIRTRFGEEVFQNLLGISNVTSLVGDPIKCGTKEFDALFKAMAAIHYRQLDELDVWANEMIDYIQIPEEVFSYSKCLVNSLINNGLTNNAIHLYEKLHNHFIQIKRLDLAQWSNVYKAVMMYNCGQYDNSWAFVSDIIPTIDNDNYIPNNPDLYIRKLLLLGILYNKSKNDYTKAIKVYNKALATVLSSSQNGQSALSLIELDALSVIYNNLAYLEKDQDKAIEYTLSAIDCRRKIARHENYLEIFENGILWPVDEYSILAGIYMETGKLDEAEDLLKKCLSHYQTYYSDHEKYFTNLYKGFISLYKLRGDIEKMIYYSDLCFKNAIHLFLKRSSDMNSVQRSDLWHKTNPGFFDIFSRFSLENNQFTELAYNSALIEKGLLLRYNYIIKDNVYTSNDEKLIQAYEKFKNAERHGLGSKKVLEDRFMYLYSAHKEFNDSFSFYTWKDVQSHLKSRDVAIEFATCCSDGETITYAALVLRNDLVKPIIVPLGSNEEFEKIFNTGAATYRNNDMIYSLVWEKIEPYLKDVKNIYFSPQGVISQINIEVLENKNGEPLNKLYNISRLSSTSKICEKDSNFKATSATLFGALDYETSTTDLVSSSKTFSSVDVTNNYTLEYVPEISRAGWNYLPGTEKEITQIGKILDSNKIDRTIFSHSQGTEESFKSMSGHSTPIIHIATHGFYMNEREAERNKPSLLLKEENDSHSYPLRRCGLILAGGQHAWLGEKLPKGIEDGILTGEEIAGMNLSNTDLLVLSACQTGLGEVTHDGVIGLQRAFKIAGVGTIIMSLWNIDDKATELMMTKFYTHLTKGKTKRDSFKNAIEDVKKEYADPKYWAAFIMLD